MTHRNYSRLLALDFDGTLLRRDGQLNPADLEALAALGEHDVLRVIISGRNLWSFEHIIAGLAPIPIDYLVFSTGLGIVHWPERHLVRQAGLDVAATRRAARLLEAMNIDYTVHEPVPHNHRFWYYRGGNSNADLDRRLAFYPGHCAPLEERIEPLEESAQLIGMTGTTDPGPYHEVKQQLGADYTVIRTTSPIDRTSLWIEVFPAGVHKGTAAAWLAERHDIHRASTMAIGNDYNDQDLLDWAERSYVVGNAPADLRQRYPVVASCDQAGVAQAISQWLR